MKQKKPEAYEGPWHQDEPVYEASVLPVFRAPSGVRSEPYPGSMWSLGEMPKQNVEKMKQATLTAAEDAA
jgi:hypothetical protein